jgi:hypothetical protein
MRNGLRRFGCIAYPRPRDREDAQEQHWQDRSFARRWGGAVAGRPPLFGSGGLRRAEYRTRAGGPQLPMVADKLVATPALRREL